MEYIHQWFGNQGSEAPQAKGTTAVRAATGWSPEFSMRPKITYFEQRSQHPLVGRYRCEDGGKEEREALVCGWHNAPSRGSVGRPNLATRLLTSTFPLAEL
jgi:hypothetical protein